MTRIHLLTSSSTLAPGPRPRTVSSSACAGTWLTSPSTHTHSHTRVPAQNHRHCQKMNERTSTRAADRDHTSNMIGIGNSLLAASTSPLNPSSSSTIWYCLHILLMLIVCVNEGRSEIGHVNNLIAHGHGDGSGGSGSGSNNHNRQLHLSNLYNSGGGSGTMDNHGGGGGTSSNSNGNGNGLKPTIETYGNVTVLAGQTGQLKCKVTNLGNYTVSWIRHRDTHLLTSGAVGYTADQRFRAFSGPGETWGLRISTTRPTDSGVYECQISTTPPIPAFTVLFVVEPVTHIEGLNDKRSELFIKAGSTINLTCVVEDSSKNAPRHVLWQHNSRTINFEWARGGMNMVTERKADGVTVSRLLIQKAMRTDSGVYTCTPENAHSASVKIHVLEQGEKQAAMQSKSYPSSSPPSFFALMAVVAATAVAAVVTGGRDLPATTTIIWRPINPLVMSLVTIIIFIYSTAGRFLTTYSLSLGDSFVESRASSRNNNDNNRKSSRLRSQLPTREESENNHQNNRPKAAIINNTPICPTSSNSTCISCTTAHTTDDYDHDSRSHSHNEDSDSDRRLCPESLISSSLRTSSVVPVGRNS